MLVHRRLPIPYFNSLNSAFKRWKEKTELKSDNDYIERKCFHYCQCQWQARKDTSQTFHSNNEKAVIRARGDNVFRAAAINFASLLCNAQKRNSSTAASRRLLHLVSDWIRGAQKRNVREQLNYHYLCSAPPPIQCARGLFLFAFPHANTHIAAIMRRTNKMRSIMQPTTSSILVFNERRMCVWRGRRVLATRSVASFRIEHRVYLAKWFISAKKQLTITMLALAANSASLSLLATSRVLGTFIVRRWKYVFSLVVFNLLFRNVLPVTQRLNSIHANGGSRCAIAREGALTF